MNINNKYMIPINERYWTEFRINQIVFCDCFSLVYFSSNILDLACSTQSWVCKVNIGELEETDYFNVCFFRHCFKKDLKK